MRTAFLGRRDRANCPQRACHHGRAGGRGDELMATSGDDYEVRDEDRLPWLETVDEDYSDGPSNGRKNQHDENGQANNAAANIGVYWFKKHQASDGNGA